MFQKLTIVGNLGRDPEMRYQPDGTAVTNRHVACPGQGKKALFHKAHVLFLDQPLSNFWSVANWNKQKRPRTVQSLRPLLLENCALTEIRTPVLSLKGLRPSPLDDEGNRRNSIILYRQGQVLKDWSSSSNPLPLTLAFNPFESDVASRPY